MDDYVATLKFKWNNATSPGWLARWLSPGDFYAVAIKQSDGKARLYKRVSDGTLSAVVASGTALSLTTNTWYTAKVVVDTDAGSQRLRFWVDTDGDGDYADETVLLNTNTIDDTWDAGYVGLFRGQGSSTTQQFDDVKVGFDNNGDDDIADAGDDIQIDDNFDTNVITLTRQQRQPDRRRHPHVRLRRLEQVGEGHPRRRRRRDDDRDVRVLLEWP